MLRTGTLAKGLLSVAFERFRNPHSDFGFGSSEVVYSRFIRFLKQYNSTVPGAGLPSVVAELGPGSSLGFGLAALIAGAHRYYALDLIKQFSTENNLRMFDELVGLFKNRTPVPNNGYCARLFPFVENLAFPEDILGGEELSAALATDRLKQLRRDIETETGNCIRYFVPWQEHVADLRDKPDWIVSNSVLEHVDDLESTYRAFSAWSKVGTVMCHLIDYSSHTMTTLWNEHWRIGNVVWALARGKRHYFINRAPNAEHLSYLAKYNFELIAEQKLRRVDGLLPEEFFGPFRSIDTEDAGTHLAFLVSKYN